MIRWLLALILGLYLAIVGLVTFVGLDSIHHARESQRNTIALCSLRDNLGVTIKERLHSIVVGERLLANPAERGGISKAVLVQSIANNRLLLHQNQRSYNDLSAILRCDES